MSRQGEWVSIGDLEYSIQIWYKGKLCSVAESRGFSNIVIRDLDGRFVAEVDEVTEVQRDRQR